MFEYSKGMIRWWLTSCLKHSEYHIETWSHGGKMITAYQIATCVIYMDLLLTVIENFKTIGDVSHQKKPSIFN